VEDIAEVIPPSTVRWFGPAFRYTDRGWTFVHIEGEPYQRGYQYGTLLAQELAAYIEKLAIRQNSDNPRNGWNELRTLTDALMFRKYDEEYLVEMRGIADGAAKAGAQMSGRPLDHLDVVTVNSAVDLGQLGGALAKTPGVLTGRSFRADEEEANAAERLHKCSSFLANGPATPDGGIVFGQLFMWNGYTGVHWDVICDVVPSAGHRLVYQTFPGGIHSGADFYLNDAGIMIGETTVMQTPFNIDGTPQSFRIRKAAQYGSSIDDVVKILSQDNNGLYTNDWLIGDAKNNETAILLLGTEKSRVWRSRKKDFPGDTEGFLWSVNNAKDPEVRKEYVADPSNAPVDVVFGPVNRDVAFLDYYRREKGRIDAISAVNALSTSPLNRPHACDGKVTTSEMASQMMFMAHYGKVTLREKLVEKNGRLMPDLPGAIPHLTLGWSTFNPVYVVEKLKAMRPAAEPPAAKETVVFDAKELYQFPKKLLWSNTVYPASDADNWFVSATAAYWQTLSALPADQAKAMTALRDQLTESSCRLQYVTQSEGLLVPTAATRRYDRFGSYQVPRIRGTFALHQLRLMLGNQVFSQVMNGIHGQFDGKPVATAKLISRAEEVSKKTLEPFVRQWVDRGDFPAPTVTAAVTGAGSSYTVTLTVKQGAEPYHFFTTLAIETEKDVRWRVIECSGTQQQQVTLEVESKPVRVVFNAGSDIPVSRPDYFTFSNLFDDFKHTTIVYGTSRQTEANHTAALRFQTVLADQFTEDLLPVKQDNEIGAVERASGDLLLIGGPADNSCLTGLLDRLELAVGKNWFRWRGKTYADPDDGLYVVYPNPYNTQKLLHLFIGNSALQNHQMTKKYTPLPSWAVFKGDLVVTKGYHGVDRFEEDLTGEIQGGR
jgi:hypothetical protein